MSRVTIGFVPRDRFCEAAESLQRVFDHTHIPFNLIVVDCNIPEVFRQQMEAVLEDRDNVKVIRTDHYLLTNQAHNLIVQENEDEYLCLIENDILVEEGWLSHLVTACDEYPADVAVPLIIERQGEFEKIHFDDRLGHIQPVQTPEGTKLEIVQRTIPKEVDPISDRRTIGMLETHCVLYRSKVFDRIGPFDETMSARAEVDVSLALYQAGARIVFEPKARVVYSTPPPIYPEEREYYLFKWSPERAAENHDHLVAKWDLADLPSSVDFVKRRRKLAAELDPERQQQLETEYRTKIDRTAQDIAASVPSGDAVILVDQQELNAGDVAPGRRAIPFLERDGQYWGAPPDDDTAIREMERLRRSGARYMAFAWPAFWWFDYYNGLHSHLRSNFRCVLENERLVVFDLNGEAFEKDQR